MNNKINRYFALASRSLLVSALAGLCIGASAQQDSKSIVAEPVQAFPTFTQWVTSVIVAAPEPVSTVFESVPLVLAAPVAQVAYQPSPVILGLPELPLLGNGVALAGRSWTGALNYQGLHLQQVVLNPAGNRRELRPMATPLRAGERFKIRVTATFDAVAEVDQVVGDAWYGVRTGQIYPRPGVSVQIKAGDTVDLPIEPNGYFLMNRPANERLVVSVRHPFAQQGSRSEQPAYRQDAVNGSSYLQLVPRGKFAAIEQLVSQGQ